MTTITTPNYVVLARPLAGCIAPVAQPFNGNIREAFEREAHMHRCSQEELNLKNKSRQYRKSIGIIVWALDHCNHGVGEYSCTSTGVSTSRQALHIEKNQ